MVGTGDGESETHSDYDNDEQYDENDDDEEEELKFPDDDSNIRKASSSDMHKSADSMGGASGNDSNGGGQRSESEGMVSRNSNQKLPLYASVKPIVPEELGISYADNIFKDCAETYQIFVDKNHDFLNAVTGFQKLVLPDQTNPEWEDSLQAYKGLLENENKRVSDKNGDEGKLKPAFSLTFRLEKVSHLKSYLLDEQIPSFCASNHLIYE